VRQRKIRFAAVVAPCGCVLLMSDLPERGQVKDALPDRTVIGGVAVAAIIAIITGFTANPSKSVILGVAIGLAGAVLALQVDVLVKLERASRFEDAVSGVEWLRSAVLRLAAAIGAIETEGQLTPFRANARREVQSCLTNLQDMARGQLRARVGEGILEQRTDLAQTALLAVSIQGMDVPRWQSDLGQKYWQANLRALTRPKPLHIERVFVYRDWDALMELVLEQATAGVITHAVDRAVVPGELMIDMAVWDNAFTYQFELNSEGEPNQESLLCQ
jgi:hypothetical protein